MAEHSKPSSSQESDTSERRDTKTSSITLVQVPDEILIYVLTFISDTKSLRAAMASCKAIQSIFQHNKMRIMSEIFFYKMEEGVFQEALITDRLKQEKWRNARSGAKAIHRIYRSERSIPNQDLTFEKIEAMLRLHESVEFFADRIPTTLLREHPVTKEEEHFSLTPKVRARFQRALYRLASYLIIMEKVKAATLNSGGQDRRIRQGEEAEPDWVRRMPNLDEHRVLLAFHSYYSAFEIEQLSCICGLLITEIAPSFNHFLQHDIELGSRVKFYLTHPLDSGGMNLVALGLPFLHEFMTAATRAGLYKVVRPVADQINWKPDVEERISFPDHDESLDMQLHDHDPTFSQWAHVETPDFIMRTPFFDDHDSGPASAWSAMSRFSLFMSPTTNQADTERLPRLQPLPWAYVFWDLKMLQNSGFTNIDEKDRIESADGLVIPPSHPAEKDWEPLKKYNSNADAEFLFLSGHKKRQMLKNGLTGYFDFETFCKKNQNNLISNYTETSSGVMMRMIDSLPTERDLATFMQIIMDFMDAGGNPPPGLGGYYGS